ncbi:MAG: DUF4296 domain-containing protein [Flavobacteriales bacterium]|nr:DUF4296 domain-containing protein [Flavobacteriales bacterium]
MIRKFYILTSMFALSFLLYFAGCGKKSDPVENAVPTSLIQEREMVNIIADMQLIEAIYRKNQFEDYDSLKIKSYYARIFIKYNVDQEQFDKSLDYYQKSPRKMERIYTQVIDKLSALEEEVKSG